MSLENRLVEVVQSIGADVKQLFNDSIPLLTTDPSNPDLYDTWMLLNKTSEKSQILYSIGGMPVISHEIKEEVFIKIKTLENIKKIQLNAN